MSDIARQIQQLALRGYVEKDGALAGTAKVSGYVCGIHSDDEADEALRGTIDVQEYNSDGDELQTGEGFHEGVLITAPYTGSGAYRLIPRMYSEVVISKDPVSQREYVVLFSHVRVVEALSSEKITLGVIPTEEFSEGDSGADVGGLTAVGDETSIVMKDDSSITMTADSLSLQGKSIVLGSGSDSMVLGDKLSEWLSDLCSAISAITVNTPHGVSSVPLNAQQFSALSSKLQEILSETAKLS